MRTIVPFLLFLSILGSCNDKNGRASDAAAQPASTATATAQTADSVALTEIEWKEQSINFGKIKEGQKLEVVFHFKNTGTNPLVITRVQPGCGCTVAETPKEPIAPGKEGVIKGAFDSNGRTGTQHKSIVVYANTKGKQNHELVFEVEVQKKS